MCLSAVAEIYGEFTANVLNKQMFIKSAVAEIYRGFTAKRLEECQLKLSAVAEIYRGFTAYCSNNGMQL